MCSFISDTSEAGISPMLNYSVRERKAQIWGNDDENDWGTSLKDSFCSSDEFVSDDMVMVMMMMMLPRVAMMLCIYIK